MGLAGMATPAGRGRFLGMKSHPTKPQEGVQIPLALSPRASWQFRNFLPAENQATLAALQQFAVAQATGEQWVRWLVGGSGSGKTHLLSAWVNAGAQAGLRAGYLSLAHVSAPAMLQGMEEQAALALDDMDAVLGQHAWDEALFHLFNALHDRGQRLLLASRTSWVELIEQRDILPDLVSRLRTALVYPLKPLDEEACMQALSVRAEERGIVLSDEVLRYLRTRSSRDVHALFELLDTLDQQSLVDQRRITVPYVRSFFGG
jgi:DnaA family protein